MTSKSVHFSPEEKTAKPKRKQKKKKGKVVRITPDLVALIAKEHQEGETIPETLRRLTNPNGERVKYVLPSDIHETVEDARGTAIVRAVRARRRKAERPVPVRTVK